MPQVTVYIREEDLPTWKRISKKSEFIHNSLQTAGAYMDLDAAQRTTVKEHLKAMPKNIEPRVEKFVPKPPDPETGYPCCTKARPCKHWQWDSGKSVYINSLTGKQREPDL